MSNHLVPIAKVRVLLNSQRTVREIQTCLEQGGTAHDVSNLIGEIFDRSFPPTKKEKGS